MRSWFALVLAPGAALAVQSAMYILVLPACANQSTLRLHGSAAVALAITLGLALLARADWRHHDSEAAPPDDSGLHFGLVGMAERARALGGSLEAGPTADGWLVTAAVRRTAEAAR